MPASRNPFFIRTAEQSESDDQFLSLFSLSVLDLLPEDGSWNRPPAYRIAPRGGQIYPLAIIHTDRTHKHCQQTSPV